MKVLSLFDGIACGYEALLRAGFTIEKYYASEIDKYAIQVAMKNHPDIIQIGDVCSVKGEDYQDIDLLIGGSPCQGFSLAGKMLNFDDPRSKLFFEFVRILREVKPKYFLLENVKMKKEWQDIISRELGVEPIEINSSLVSAQNRRRLYRTNIPNISQPTDKGIKLKDILEEYTDSKYDISEKHTIAMKNARSSGELNIQNPEGKCGTLVAGYYKIPQDGPYISKLIEIKNGEVRVKQATKQGYIVAHEGDGIDLNYPKSNTRRGRVIHQKSNTLTTGGEAHVYNKVIRKLTPVECERLQTLPDNYTEGVSDTQRYKALGNGRTVDVIAHIFSYMECKSPIKDAVR